MQTKKLKPTKDFSMLKPTHNNVEIEGVKKLFNDFMQLHDDMEEVPKYGFFYCDNSINSEDSANGKPIIFEGLKVDYIDMGANGLTYVICEDDKENKFCFEFNAYSGDFYLMD